jgi:hypothetical protein
MVAGRARSHLLGRCRAPAFEVARPVLVARTKLPKQPFVDVIWGTEALLTDRNLNDFEALAAWADLDQGALFELIARGHGESTPRDRLRRPDEPVPIVPWSIS